MCLIRFETVLAFSKQKSLNLNLFTMKNINDLPDLCLRTIFSKLPLRDLLRIDQVCPAWERIQPSVCLMRKELTILIGDEPQNLIKDSPFILPYYDELLDMNQNVSKVDSESKDQNQLEFDWLDRHSAKMLTFLLPNITTVCIAIRYVVPAISIGEKSWGIKTILMNQVIVLLQKWSHKIKTLKLFINFDESTADEKQIENDLQKLVSTINSCQVLRHLTVKLENNFFANEELENQAVDLSILSKLEEFYLKFSNNMSVVNDSLVKYGQGPGLRALAIDGIVRFDTIEAGTFQRYDDSLAEKFTQLPDLEFNEANFAMGTFCTRFYRLERLSIRIVSGVDKIYKFAKLIRPLKSLVYLNLHFHRDEDDDFDDDEDDDDEGGAERRRRAAEERRQQQAEPEIRDFESIPQLPSVKIIKIYASLRSHDQLDSIQWDRMFPNLEILHYNDGYYDCTICEPKNEAENNENNTNQERENNEEQNIEPEIVVNPENNENDQQNNELEMAVIPDNKDQQNADEQLNDNQQNDEPEIVVNPENNEPEIVPNPENNENNDPDAVFRLNNDNDEDAENRRLDEEEEEEERKHDKCLKFALQPWKHCAKLHSVYTGDYGCSNVKKRSLDELYDRD